MLSVSGEDGGDLSDHIWTRNIIVGAGFVLLTNTSWLMCCHGYDMSSVTCEIQICAFGHPCDQLFWGIMVHVFVD